MYENSGLGVRKLRNTQAGASELLEVTAVAKEMGVLLEQRYSRMAGTAYLANICRCGALLGDNFVYAGFSSSENYETDLTTAVRHYEVCRDGHWRLLAERRWPPDSGAMRRTEARGLCGSWAGVFDEAEPLVSVKKIDTSTVSALDIARAFAFGRW